MPSRRAISGPRLVFGNDEGSQIGVPTLLKGYSEVGGQMVVDQKIILGQTSYQSQVEQLIAARPQVIFTETSPLAPGATYLAELQQLGHLIAVVGADQAIRPSWFRRRWPGRSASAGAERRHFVAESPYAPASRKTR